MLTFELTFEEKKVFAQLIAMSQPLAEPEPQMVFCCNCGKDVTFYGTESCPGCLEPICPACWTVDFECPGCKYKEGG